MSKYTKQVIQFAERETGVVVQFAGMAGIYELPRTHLSYDHFARLLQAAKKSGIPVSFEIEDHRIVSVG
jgi:hypothetical protein